MKKFLPILFLLFSQISFGQIVHAGKALFGTGIDSLGNFNYDNLIDSSKGNNLIIGGQAPPTVVKNVFFTGNAGISFSGLTNLVSWGANYNLTSNYTFEVRLKRDINNLSKKQIIFGRWGSTPASEQYQLYLDTSNNLIFIQQNGTLIHTLIADSINHNIAISKMGSKYYLFLDGIIKDSASSGTIQSINDSIPFRVGDDDGSDTILHPLFGIVSDFRFSNIARYTASYSVPTTYLPNDSNTISLLRLDTLAGNYLSQPVYQGNLITRSGFPQASGGWANPDGFLTSLDGSLYFSVSGWNGSRWTVYAAILGSSISNTAVVQANAIQTPSGEGNLAGNGTVIPFKGNYFNFYMDAFFNVKYSKGVNLNSAFSTGTIIFAANTGGWNGYVDPFVRQVGDSLEMFMGGGLNVGSRTFLRTRSADGIHWTTPINMGLMLTPHNNVNTGEPSALNFNGTYYLFGDGLRTPSVGREVCRWISKDGIKTIPLLKFIPAAGGSYIASYDCSPYYNPINKQVVFLVTNSTNTQQTQPTNSDIGVWTSTIINK